MLRRFLRWLGLIDDGAPELSPEAQARVARLDAMRDDIYRLTHEEWWAKWRPDEPVPKVPRRPRPALSSPSPDRWGFWCLP